MSATDVHKEYFESLIGKEINNTYRVERLLGRGGMGAVFLAQHIHLGDKVAIKVLSPDLTDDSSLIKRFQREAKVGWSLTHPNIVKVSDFGKTDANIFFMVMEYVDGETLEKYMETHGRLPLRRCIEILEPLCDALEAAHTEGLLHRDLKPANILISSRKDHEIVKLLDFGIVKLLQSDEHVSQLTAVGQVFGTPLYMSPEHLMGLTLGAPADIYSIGVIAFTMLTGELPMDHEDLRKLFEMKMRGIEPPTKKYPFLPAGLDAVLRKVLNPQTDQRYQTAHEFLAALKQVAAESPEEAQTTVTSDGPTAPLENPVTMHDTPTVVDKPVAPPKPEPSATPPPAPAAGSPAPVSAPTSPGGTSTGLWIGVGVAVLIILAVVGYFLSR